MLDVMAVRLSNKERRLSEVLDDFAMKVFVTPPDQTVRAATPSPNHLLQSQAD